MSQLVKDFKAVLEATVPTATVKPALGKNYTLPVAVYSVRNGMRELFYNGSFGLRQTEFTVTVYSKSYDEMQALKSLIINQFHGFSGTLETSPVTKIEVTNILDGFDDALETIHRTSIIINVMD